jgi:hypothetical protein
MAKSRMNRLGVCLVLALGFCMLVAESTQAQVRRGPQSPQLDIRTDAAAYRPGDPVRVTVTSDGPVFVAVFEVSPEGEVHRITGELRGVKVRPNRPLHLGGGRYVRAGLAGQTALFAVAQQEPFRRQQLAQFARDLETHYRRTGGANITFRAGYVDRHGRQPSQVIAGTSYRVHTRWAVCGVCGRHERRHDCAHVNIPAGARVFVDGLFVGFGFEALYSAGPGWHRVTVVTPAGRKYTERVRIGGTSVWREGPMRGEKPDGSRYQREKH